MLDNQTRRELLSKARQSGFPGSILDVFTAYEQGKDLIGEFQQQQQQQQSQQMSDMAAQQSGMMAPGQQPLPQEMPQAPAPPPPGLQGQQLPGPPPPANPNLVDSTQQQPVGMATNAKGSSGGQVIMATGGFVEKFTDDQYNKFSSHFPFSKEQRGSIAHRATVEHPDLTMVQGKKYVFGGLKYAAGGMKKDPPEWIGLGNPNNPYTLPTVEIKGKKSTPNRPPYKNVEPYNSEPVPKFLEPGFQDELSYLEAKNKLRLRQELEGAQARAMSGENFFDFVDDRGRAGDALREMYIKYPNDERLRAKEEIPSNAVAKWFIQQAAEKYAFKGLNKVGNFIPASWARFITPQQYQKYLQSAQGASNIESFLDLENVYNSVEEGKNKYAYYTEELQKKVDDYEKAHGTYQSSFVQNVLSNVLSPKVVPAKFAAGGFDGDPLKKGNIATAADSSYVAEAANAPHNFYKKAGYTVLPPGASTDIPPSEIFKALAEERKYVKSNQNSPYTIRYNDYTNYRPGEHRFEQRELTHGQINKKAPMSRYDDRILPQGMVSYGSYGGAGDLAEVPKYDKLAVTPWKDLSDAQKIQRLQKYGGSGTPYKDKASVKQGIQDLKNPVPQPKMKEAGLLPLPKIDLQPQLQNKPNPYVSGPETEYFIMPSGNPGVGVIHGRTYDGKGGYNEKIIGPSLAKDWFNDADQKKFDNNDMSGRIDYDPRDNDPDHKVYEDMYSATQEIEKLREELKQQQKQKLRLQMRKENEANQGAVKFATGGIDKKELELDIKPCPRGHIYDPSLGRCVSTDIYTVSNLLRDDGIDSQQAIKQNDQYYQANEFTKAWQQSPMYDKMLKEADPANYEYIRKMRLANLESTPPLKILPQPEEHPRWGGLSYSSSGQVEMFPLGFGTTTDTHELSHSSDRPVAGTDLRLIPQRDVDYINKHKGKVFGDSREYHNNKKQYDADFKEYQGYGKEKQDNYKEFYSDYVGEATEVRARLSVIRQIAADRGLYNPFRQGVTPELYYQKLKNYEFEKKKKDFDPMRQLQQTFSDEEIIWLLNHMSEAPVKEKEEIFRGKTGGFNQGNYKLLKKRK